jgi:hypothetical protein
MDRWVLVRGASAAAGHRGVNRPPAVWLARILGGVGFGMPSSRKPPACPRHVAGRVAAVCGGRRGGVCSRSPRARARGLYAGRVSVGTQSCSAKKPPARAGGLFGKEAPSASWGTVRQRSPQRELGDCDVAHQLVNHQAKRCCLFRYSGWPCSAQIAGWQAGWRLFPQSPGSRPGLVCGRGRKKSGEPALLAPSGWSGGPRRFRAELFRRRP